MSPIPGAPTSTVAQPALIRHARAGRRGALRTLAALAALATAASASSAAQQGAAPSYGVEIIVFRVTGAPQGEDWDAVPAGRGFGSSVAHGGTPEVLRVLTPADYRLGAIEATLKSSGAWRPVAHAAWVQTAAAWGTHAGIALADIGVNVPGLSGMVYLERAPIYLHLGFDVRLTAGATYAIREMRSVRYNDKQYFDHPGFGIIALVTPIRHGGDVAPTQ